ncbi:MAG: hypothetical protein M5U26_15320 [Planctomycetota bacterium]|nr:hypothetical protein [Planctomycetota bacterium]
MRLNALWTWECVRLLSGKESRLARLFFKELKKRRPCLYRRVEAFSDEERHDLMVCYLNALLRTLAAPGSLILTLKNLRRLADDYGLGDEDIQAIRQALDVAFMGLLRTEMELHLAQAWKEALDSFVQMLNSERAALSMAS